MKNKKPLILAPVGGPDTLVAAVRAGADSIYCGLDRFNARASAQSFGDDGLARTVEYCHARGVSVNVTLNTILYDKELPAFLESARAVARAGADAVIVQDMGAAAILRAAVPDLALHGSTQMAVHTPSGARQLAAMGFSRVILGREMTREQIAAATAPGDIETEVFVHGAMCVCLSGQCYASAFLGGRSGNRGRCAGTCRLPFSAGGAPGIQHDLSLRDQSLVDALPQLGDMGVVCVKIEGRLRTPEYVAAAVTACRAARDGLPYDKARLDAAFSRSGPSRGFYDGGGGNMFGVRTPADEARTKAVLPALRELYRREYPGVGVHFSLTARPDGFTLEAGDGVHTVSTRQSLPLAPADNPGDGAARALAKCGGTPFYAHDIQVEDEGLFLPGPAVAEARRQVLDDLLALRSAPAPLPERNVTLRIASAQPRQPVLRARFEQVEQLPGEWAGLFQKLIFPLDEYEKVPAPLRDKTILELPRAMFEGQDKTVALTERARAAGFTAFEAGNIGHLPFLRPGEGHGGFSLNISNGLAAAEYARLGLESLVLSPELLLGAATALRTTVPTGLLLYGALPLMTMRACPLRRARGAAGCKGCPKTGFLLDRTGRKLPVLCRDGARRVLNPVPLYMGDRLHEVGTDFGVLYFTTETPAQAADVIQAFTAGLPFPGGDYTRGLYYKGAL